MVMYTRSIHSNRSGLRKSRRRIRQQNHRMLSAKIIAEMLDVDIETVRRWRKIGILSGYGIADLKVFLHTYFIWRGVEAGQPWHTLIEKEINPDDEGIPSPRHGPQPKPPEPEPSPKRPRGRPRKPPVLDQPKRPRGRPRNPERHPRKALPPKNDPV